MLFVPNAPLQNGDPQMWSGQLQVWRAKSKAVGVVSLEGAVDRLPSFVVGLGFGRELFRLFLG